MTVFRTRFAVLRTVVHVGELQAGLQFQFLTVEEIICAEVELVVLVPSTSDDAVFVRSEQETVRVLAAEGILRRASPSRCKDGCLSAVQGEVDLHGAKPASRRRSKVTAASRR